MAKAPAAKVETVTLKHIAASLAEAHELPKKQAIAILEDLIAQLTKHLKKGARASVSSVSAFCKFASVRHAWAATRQLAKLLRSRHRKRLPSALPRN